MLARSGLTPAHGRWDLNRSLNKRHDCGALTAYNLIRLEMAKAALEAKCEPNEISFIRVFHIIQYGLHWAAVTRAYGKLPALMQRFRQRIVMLLNEERPGRKIDRAVKALPQRYTAVS